jgi:hypothetical protein
MAAPRELLIGSDLLRPVRFAMCCIDWASAGMMSSSRPPRAVCLLCATISLPIIARSLPTGFPGRFGGGTGGTGAAGTGTAATGVTVGTVTVISGKMLYLTSSSGAIVKAKLTGTTTYTRNATTTKAGLKPGDTAIVQGGKNAAGVVVATSVSATAKGVTSATGGFPCGIGTGGGAPTGTRAPGG